MLNLVRVRSFVTVIIAACLAVATSAAAQTVTLKIGLGHPVEAYANWADTFKAGLAKRVGGRIKVEVYPSMQLGGARAMMQGARDGAIGMVMMAPAWVDRRYLALYAPGIFDDLMHGFRTVHDPAFKKAFWSIDAKGLKMVSMTCDAASAYATSTPIRSLADFRGRKLRTASMLETEALRRLGAAGVMIAFPEVWLATERKVIAGARSSVNNLMSIKYQSVARYMLKAHESLFCSGRFVSRVWLDKLTPGLRQALLDQALATDPLNQAWIVKSVDRMYRAWVNAGGELAELSPDDQKEMQRRLSTVGDDVLKDRPAVLEAYRVMKEAAARTRGG